MRNIDADYEVILVILAVGICAGFTRAGGGAMSELDVVGFDSPLGHHQIPV